MTLLRARVPLTVAIISLNASATGQNGAAIRDMNQANNEKRETSMDERKKRRKEYRTWKKGYYHLCTDGWKDGLLFHDEGEYVNAVNSISLLDLKYPVKVHFYEVMRNHLHLIMSGWGTHCVDSFDYLKKRIGSRLRKDGRPPLPPDYDFRLIPIENEEHMRDNLVYVAMNASKKMDILPGGYLWGSAFMVYSDLPRLFESILAGDLSGRELEKMFGTHLEIPSDRLIHPGLGMVLPQSFVDPGVFYRMFPKSKEYLIRLVKDYEAYTRIARQVGEEVDYILEEALDIVKLELDKLNLSLDKMSVDDRCRLAVQLYQKYQLKADMLSSVLLVPEHIIAQKLYAERPKKR